MRNVACAGALAVAIAAALALASPDATDRRGPVAAAADRSGDRRPDGLLVLAVLGPEHALVADPRTGRTRERQLAGGTLCHGPVLASGARVVLGGMRGGRPVALSLPLTLTGRGRSLGRADTFAASPRPNRVWLVRWTHLRRTSARVSVREATLGGTGGPVAERRLPRRSSLEAVMDDGFLAASGRGLTLWREGARRDFRNGWLLAAGGSRFAWCRGPCRHVVVWSHRGERVLALPGRLRANPGGRAAFSPGEDRLALPLRGEHGARVGVVDVDGGDWTVVPGARLAGYESIAWSPSGRWLYFTGPGKRLFAWRLGASRPVRLPVRPGGTVMSIATTT